MSGCSGKSSSAKWLEIGSTGQLINLDKVTDIIPGHDPNKLIWGNNTSGYIRFFNPRETSVSFPNEKAANDSYLRIIYFLKSNDRYLKL